MNSRPSLRLWRLKVKQESARMKRWTMFAVLSVIACVSCNGVLGGSPRHFREITEWPNADLVAAQLMGVTEPLEEGGPLRNRALMDRFDYLESYGCSINAFRKDDNPCPWEED